MNPPTRGSSLPGQERATFWQFSDPESANPVLVTLSNYEQTTQLGGKSVEYKLQLYEDSYHVQEYL